SSSTRLTRRTRPLAARSGRSTSSRSSTSGATRRGASAGNSSAASSAGRATGPCRAGGSSTSGRTRASASSGALLPRDRGEEGVAQRLEVPRAFVAPAVDEEGGRPVDAAPHSGQEVLADASLV